MTGGEALELAQRLAEITGVDVDADEVVEAVLALIERRALEQLRPAPPPYRPDRSLIGHMEAGQRYGPGVDAEPDRPGVL